jgi:hypothetical protein
MNKTFFPPKIIIPIKTLKNTIWDLKLPKPAKEKNYTN